MNVDKRVKVWYNQYMAYSEDYKRRAIDYKNEGHTKKHVCEVFKIPYMTLTRWINRLEKTGSLDNKYPEKHSGKIDLEKLKQAVERKPDAYLSELATQFGCTRQAIFYALKRLEITHKKRHSHTPKNQC